ncbi:branched-chain amino acid ABC transporter permease [Pusillimonas noertemannii]|uniref:branched-chain amino acid ABC transporter permease n=1 Tax=Pusillimonas noertemannii TaxID=305977 RepID=UPI0002DA7D7E|nr:branched-chain amino acid ABC transporter permease [Pusillimonas noertemannii]
MDWLAVVMHGTLAGGGYALFAIGLSLAYGVMRLVNIAHGDFIVLAAYIALVIAVASGLHPLLALPIVAAIMFGLGYLLQRTVLNRVLGPDILPPLLVTFGLAIILQNGLLEVFSADARVLPAGTLATDSVSLGGGLAVGLLPLATFMTAVACTLGLSWLFRYTRLGVAFRATSDDPHTAQLVGIKDKHIYALAMGIAFAVMAVGGVFMGMRASFTPDLGPSYLIYSFEAVVIGGVGSIWGTLAGAILLGVAQGVGYSFGPGWGILTGHIVFLLVLLFRPAGLFSRSQP